MSAHFTFSDQPRPFQLPATGVNVTFLVHPMTQEDHDKIGYELFRHNIMPMSQDVLRANIIDEVYNLYGEEKGEDIANVLDAHWQAKDIHEESLTAWSEQELQRNLDIASGAPHRDPAPLPTHPQSPRDRAKATTVFNQLMEDSLRLRELTIKQQQAARFQQEGMIRILLMGWDGLGVTFVKENGIIPLSVWNDLKAEIGAMGVTQLIAESMEEGIVSKEERGNSASPAESASDQTGSLAQSDASVSSDGSSTTSNTSPAQTGGSGVTTKLPLTSTSSFGGASPSTGDIQTAEG